MYAKAGSATVFEIPFVGYPVPEVMWFYNEKDLPRTKKYQVMPQFVLSHSLSHIDSPVLSVTDLTYMAVFTG